MGWSESLYPWTPELEATVVASKCKSFGNQADNYFGQEGTDLCFVLSEFGPLRHQEVLRFDYDLRVKTFLESWGWTSKWVSYTLAFAREFPRTRARILDRLEQFCAQFAQESNIWGGACCSMNRGGSRVGKTTRRGSPLQHARLS
jgi:hypothetical protein